MDRHRPHRPFLLPTLLFLFGLGTNAQSRKFIFQMPKMGAMFSIQVYASDSLQAKNATDIAFGAVDSLNLIFSDYLPHSELSRLSATAGSGTWVKASPALFDIMHTSKWAYYQSNQAFDVSVGALTKLWRISRQERKLSSLKARKQALKSAGMAHVLLNLKTQKIKLLQHHTQLDLGGIGKGYAADVMLKTMQQQGFLVCLCNAAGNMAIGQAPPHAPGWAVAIEGANGGVPTILRVSNGGISTSGSRFQFVEIEGKIYSHILNPKTGLGLTHARQVSIWAKTATEADWLSTACSVLPIPQAKALAKQRKANIWID